MECLTTALNEAHDLGRGDTLLTLADAYNGRDPHGRYSNINSANTAINCADQKQRYTDTDVQTHLPQFRNASPLFGDAMARSLTTCTGWPSTTNTDTPHVNAPHSAPILVIGNTGDPATPYQGAHNMAHALGDGIGINITLTGQGHGGYTSNNTCLTNLVNHYLLNNTTPPNNTTCT
jgi:hypothetical protein